MNDAEAGRAVRGYASRALFDAEQSCSFDQFRYKHAGYAESSR
jgi:hypothetical protein